MIAKSTTVAKLSEPNEMRISDRGTFVSKASKVHDRFNGHFIEALKADKEKFLSLIKTANDGVVVYVLKKLGRIENIEAQYPLLELMKSPNKSIRLLSVKNLAKLKNKRLLPCFLDFAHKDSSTEVRREAVSAIGRLKHPLSVKPLISLLNDPDPKVIMQCIRALLVFKKDDIVKKALSNLTNHPNEMIQEILKRESAVSSPNITDKTRHDVFPSYLKNSIVHGDVNDILTHIPPGSVHLTFTSPPYYNARDYSIYKSYKEYLSFLNNVFQKVYDVTKEGRFFALNTSPVIVPRVSRAHSSKRYPIPYDIHPFLVNMGWEFIDDIVWAKPEVTVKNRNAGFLQHRNPLAYKPNPVTEMIMIYRKKTNKLIDWNIKQYPREVVDSSKVQGLYETKNLWCIDPTFNKKHSAVFPVALCHNIIKFYSFKGDLVFDPFAGSGTVGKACLQLDRRFFMTEKNIAYMENLKEIFSCESIFNKNSKINFFSFEEFKSIPKGN